MSMLACQYNQPNRPGDLDLVSESRVTWATCVPILVFQGLSVLELFPIYAINRQTDVRQTDARQHHRLILPHPYAGIINDVKQ